jgi:hypothetical protein
MGNSRMDADGWMAPVIKTMGFLVEGGFLISRELNKKKQKFHFLHHRIRRRRRRNIKNKNSK